MKKLGISQKRAFCLILCMALLTLVTGCSKPGAESAAPHDVLTHKATEAGRIPLTIMCKFGVDFSALEAAAEAKFPKLDLVIVNNYTYDSDVEIQARMAANDLTDIVTLVNPEITKPYFPTCLLDMSAYPFAGRYNISALNSLSVDGSLYCLPAPAGMRCLVYNKTAFAEMGIALPNSFDEFIAMCQKIETHGIRPMRLALRNNVTREFLFTGFAYEPCYSTPEDDQWLLEYNSRGELSFYDHMKPAFDRFQTLIDNGLIQAEDFDYSSSSRIADLSARAYLITEDGPGLLPYLAEQSTDEFGLMPYFSGDVGSDWLTASPTIYFGLNRHLTDKGNEAKYELALAVMDFISSEAGQSTLFAANIGCISSVKSVPLAQLPGISDLSATIESGRYASFSKLRSDLQTVLGELVKQLVMGETTAEEAAAAIDKANREPEKVVEPIVIGTATSDFTYIDTGSFVADALRKRAGTNLALFADMGRDGAVNYSGITAKLYKGAVTDLDIKRILPHAINRISRTLNVATMTGQAVADALESVVEGSETFFYPSGLCIKYDPTAPFDQRVLSITNPDGTPFDLNKTYTVAVMGNSISDAYYSDLAAGHDAVDDVVMEAVRQAQTISPANDGRFQLVHAK